MSGFEIKTDRSRLTTGEIEAREEFTELFATAPIPREELLENIALFIKRQDLTRVMFLNELYRQILDVHGVVMEFGVRWGRDLATLQSLRGMYEPFNYTRRIIGFDTFEGYPSVHEHDGSDAVIEVGAYTVSEGYESYLEQVLAYHESESPLSHIRKFELVKGDAGGEIENYLAGHPETIVALAIFDLDVYEPTRRCLEAIAPRLAKGSVIGFGSLNYPTFPGETVALEETLGLRNCRIRRVPGATLLSYIVVE